ncbi:MAG: SGNH/GDSL hydrolase family protein [Erysipelotrichaceae bacterium]
METTHNHKYKVSKNLDEQIVYLKENKRIIFFDISEESAKEILLYNNYINVITPFKHHFARKNRNNALIKKHGNHLYDREVDFKEYFDLYCREREKYSIIYRNIYSFETSFNSLVSYVVLNHYCILNSIDAIDFFEVLSEKTKNENLAFSESRLQHMRNQLQIFCRDIEKSRDIFCFFDRLSLGGLLTIFILLDWELQRKILDNLVKKEMNFNVNQVQDFIQKVFCVVSIRNCIMHANSLEILIRFFNVKDGKLRTVTDRKRYLNMIKLLCIEKTHY